jgi:hypothetical protein
MPVQSSSSKKNSWRGKKKKFKFSRRAKNPTGKEIFERLPVYLKKEFISQAPDYVIYSALKQKNLKENKAQHLDTLNYIFSELNLKPEYKKYGEEHFMELSEISKRWYLQSLKILFDSKNRWLDRETLSKGPIEKAIIFIELIERAELFLSNYKFIAEEAKKEDDRIIAAQILAQKQIKAEREKELNDIYEQVAIRAKIKAENDINLHLKSIKKTYDELTDMIEKPSSKVWERQSQYDSHHDVRIFLRECLADIDEPLIASLFPVISIKMWDILENRYEISLTKINLNTYKYVFSKIDEVGWTSEISKQYVNHPTGFFNSLDSTLRYNDLKIRRIEFKRPAVGISVESWMIAYMAPPTEREITDSFFHWPEFFHFSVSCKSCGRGLSNVISALNQKGPVCGNHKYTWQGDHVPKVVDLIIKKSKTSDIYFSNSPLLRLRSLYYLKPVTKHENNLGLLKSHLIEREMDPRIIEQLVRSRVGSNYYSSR